MVCGLVDSVPFLREKCRVEHHGVKQLLSPSWPVCHKRYCSSSVITSALFLMDPSPFDCSLFVSPSKVA